MFELEGVLYKGSQTDGVLPNGVYAVIHLDDKFVKCLCGIFTDLVIEQSIYAIPSAKFTLAKFAEGIKIEQCILENFITSDGNGDSIWAIKICEEDDNLFELYGGLTGQLGFMFIITIPYCINENDTSSSTYSLRKSNPIDSLREKFEQMRQQMLDKSAE